MLKGVGLCKIFESGFITKRRIVAVDNVNIEIGEGEPWLWLERVEVANQRLVDYF